MLSRQPHSLLVTFLFLSWAASCSGEIGDGAGGFDGEGDFGAWTWEDDDTQDEDTDTELRAGTMQRVSVRTGRAQDAELIKALPVGRSSDGADRKVVLRLGPSDLPALQRGDHLIVPAEVQVTTRCDIGQSAAGCNYNPKVAAQLIVTGSKGDTSAKGASSKALSSVQQLTCSKNEHHCLIVFRPKDAQATLKNGFALPCLSTKSCNVNLVMWAWSPDARSGGVDKVLVGENEGNYLDNGVIGSDKARIMVIRERGITGADRKRRETSGSGTRTVPTTKTPIVVYSHKLKKGKLINGEQFVVEAKIAADTAGRARLSTQLILAKSPNATSGSLSKINPGQIGEHNGINCTGGACTIRKVAAFTADGDIEGPVYVNIVARSAVPGGGNTSVKVRKGDSWVRSTRYRASLRKAGSGPTIAR